MPDLRNTHFVPALPEKRKADPALVEHARAIFDALKADEIVAAAREAEQLQSRITRQKRWVQLRQALQSVRPMRADDAHIIQEIYQQHFIKDHPLDRLIRMSGNRESIDKFTEPYDQVRWEGIIALQVSQKPVFGYILENRKGMIIVAHAGVTPEEHAWFRQDAEEEYKGWTPRGNANDPISQHDRNFFDQCLEKGGWRFIEYCGDTEFESAALLQTAMNRIREIETERRAKFHGVLSHTLTQVYIPEVGRNTRGNIPMLRMYESAGIPCIGDLPDQPRVLTIPNAPEQNPQTETAYLHFSLFAGPDDHWRRGPRIRHTPAEGA